MKKLVLFFAAAMFAVTFAACGNKAADNKNENQEADAPKTEVIDENASATDGEVEGDVATEATPETAE